MCYLYHRRHSFPLIKVWYIHRYTTLLPNVTPLRSGRSKAAELKIQQTKTGIFLFSSLTENAQRYLISLMTRLSQLMNTLERVNVVAQNTSPMDQTFLLGMTTPVWSSQKGLAPGYWLRCGHIFRPINIMLTKTPISFLLPISKNPCNVTPGGLLTCTCRPYTLHSAM